MSLIVATGKDADDLCPRVVDLSERSHPRLRLRLDFRIGLEITALEKRRLRLIRLEKTTQSFEKLLRRSIFRAKENIASKPYRYLILGDENELDMAALQAIAPVRRISTEELFGY